MYIKKLLIIIVLFSLAITAGFGKDLKIGDKAPAFTLVDIAGETHNLKNYRGKYVVLEWVNYECPFVKKQYNSGKMQSLQKTYTAKDVIWLSINSSAPGREGNFAPAEILRRAKEHGADFTAYLTDESGRVGKLYGAKTTPHMFIINPQGNLAYAGAIDDIRSTNVKDIPKANNYVAAALDAIFEGKPIAITQTKSYGCSVKY